MSCFLPADRLVGSSWVDTIGLVQAPTYLAYPQVERFHRPTDAQLSNTQLIEHLFVTRALNVGSDLYDMFGRSVKFGIHRLILTLRQSS